MICPLCKKGETSVVDSRPAEDGTSIRRRRLCNCGERFTTFERVQYREIIVVTRDPKAIYWSMKRRQSLAYPGHNIKLFVKWYKSYYN